MPSYRKSSSTLADHPDHFASRTGGGGGDDPQSQSQSQSLSDDREDMAFFSTPPAWLPQSAFSAPATQSQFQHHGQHPTASTAGGTFASGPHGRSASSGMLHIPGAYAPAAGAGGMGIGTLGLGVGVGSAPSTMHYGIPNPTSTSTNATGASSSSSLTSFLERRSSAPNMIMPPPGGEIGVDDYLSSHPVRLAVL